MSEKLETDQFPWLNAADLSVPNLVDDILSQKSEERTELLKDARRICESLYRADPCGIAAEWALEAVREQLSEELVQLADRRHGLHFNAANASSTYLEGSFVQTAANTMQDIAPKLWKTVTGLLDASPSRRRVDVTEIKQEDDGSLGEMHEMDLGEIGGDNNDTMDVDDDDDGMDIEADEQEQIPEGGAATLVAGQADLDNKKASRRQRRAAKRNQALLLIKSVVTISIFLQSTNARCNYLQGVLGLFFHSASVPEKVVDTLAHAGLSVSVASIHKAVKKLSVEASEKVKEKLRTLRTALAYDNFDISFQTAQPTVEHSANFFSATSATAIPVFDALINPNVLQCSDFLWQRDPRNPHPSETPIIVNPNDPTNLMNLHQESFGHRSSSTNLSPLHERYAWHIRDILISHIPGFDAYRPQNGEPKPVNPIPLHKTEQIPLRAMDIKESTLDGNIQAVETLLRQGGIGEPSDAQFNPSEGDVDMSEHVLLVHGDLLTKERLESVRDCRRIEDSPKRQFQFVVFLMGLFHFKMACAESIHKAHLHPEDARVDVNSLYRHAAVLRPSETGKLVSKPGFRRMHDLIHHDIWASMSDCWSTEARLHNRKWVSLPIFAAEKPSWDLIVEISETIVKKYIATASRLASMRRKPDAERDMIFENQILRNRDELHYVELSHAMNAGDIGRVEDTFLQWVYTFRAVGKHKYAWHTIQTMLYLRKVWPKDLAQLIRMNWLCNPTGKPNCFRAIDWVVERNNLYTKVIYGGAGVNRTINRILEESILIELFRECHLTVENGFHLQHRTLRHAAPNMKRTIKKLMSRFEENKPHIFKAGRTAHYCVKDKVVEGLGIIQNTGMTRDAGDSDERQDVEADDIDAI